jgi:hypothetical protein
MFIVLFNVCGFTKLEYIFYRISSGFTELSKKIFYGIPYGKILGPPLSLSTLERVNIPEISITKHHPI